MMTRPGSGCWQRRASSSTPVASRRSGWTTSGRPPGCRSSGSTSTSRPRTSWRRPTWPAGTSTGWPPSRAAFNRCRDPRQRLLAVFAFLGEWFATPDFSGCAFINAFGELGSGSPATAQLTRQHKQRLRDYLTGLARDAGAARPAALAAQLLMLMDGAIVSAATGTNIRAAADARAAAGTLLAAATRAGA